MLYYRHLLCDTQIEMSALASVIHSPLTVFAVWEIGHNPDTKGDRDDARPGSTQVHSGRFHKCGSLNIL